MTHRLDCDGFIRRGDLFCVIASDGRRTPLCEIGCLHICPGEILVSVLPVPLPRLLVIGASYALNASAVRGIVAYPGESTDISHLKHDGEGEDGTDAGKGDEPFELIPETDLSKDGLFDLLDLAGKMVDRTQTSPY